MTTAPTAAADRAVRDLVRRWQALIDDAALGTLNDAALDPRLLCGQLWPHIPADEALSYAAEAVEHWDDADTIRNGEGDYRWMDLEDAEISEQYARDAAVAVLAAADRADRAAAELLVPPCTADPADYDPAPFQGDPFALLGDSGAEYDVTGPHPFRRPA